MQIRRMMDKLRALFSRVEEPRAVWQSAPSSGAVAAAPVPREAPARAQAVLRPLGHARRRPLAARRAPRPRIAVRVRSVW